MQIFDISRELLTTAPYPGDDEPVLQPIERMSKGALYNLSILRCSLHAATHCDAPLHFVENGTDAASIPLERCVGKCSVISVPFDVPRVDACFLRSVFVPGTRRLLLKAGGNKFLTPDGAAFLAENGIWAVGIDSNSIGPAEAELAVHVPLLQKNAVILENLCLENVSDGTYILSAAPLKIAGAEGAPCRAILIKQENE